MIPYSFWDLLLIDVCCAGFAVVRLEGSDNDDDDDEGGDSARIEAIVEEEVVDDGEAMEDIEEEGDEPVVEEAE